MTPLPTRNPDGPSGRGADLFHWDSGERLKSASLEDGTVVETKYDFDGNRVESKITRAATPPFLVKYLVDTQGILSHVVAEIVAGSVDTVFLRSANDLIGLFRPASSSTKAIHSDVQGSIRSLSDASGDGTDHYSYSAFGLVLDRQGVDSQPYRFAGEPLDTNKSLYFNRARWLSASVGRFVSVDPHPGILHQPDSLHKYLYAGGDPVNRLDPTGLSATNIPQSVASLAIAAQTQVISFGLRLQAAFQTGRSVWAVWVAMGAYAQRLARQIISLAPRVRILAENARVGPRQIDFFIKQANGVKRALVEVKWNLPWRAGPSMDRLVGQVTEAVKVGHGQVVVWTLRSPTLEQLRLVHRHLGAQASRVQFVEGVEGLYRWLSWFTKAP